MGRSGVFQEFSWKDAGSGISESWQGCPAAIHYGCLLCHSPFQRSSRYFDNVRSQLGPPALLQGNCSQQRAPAPSQAAGKHLAVPSAPRQLAPFPLFPEGLSHGVFSPDDPHLFRTKGLSPSAPLQPSGSSGPFLPPCILFPVHAACPLTQTNLPPRAFHFPWPFSIFEHLRSHPFSQIPQLSKICCSNTATRNPPFLCRFFLRVPDSPGVGEVAHGHLPDRSESLPQLPSLGGPGGSVLRVPSPCSSPAAPLPVWISHFSNQAAIIPFNPCAPLPWQMLRAKPCLPLPNVL